MVSCPRPLLLSPHGTLNGDWGHGNLDAGGNGPGLLAAQDDPRAKTKGTRAHSRGWRLSVLIPGSDEPGVLHNMPEALEAGGRSWPVSSASCSQIRGLRLLAPVPTTGSDLQPSPVLTSVIRDENALITKRPA